MRRALSPPWMPEVPKKVRRLGFSGENRQGIRVEHGGKGARQQGKQPRFGHFIHARSRADHHAVEAALIQQPREIRGACRLAQHDRGDMARVNSQGGRIAAERDHARPRMERGLRGKACRAGAEFRPARHENRAVAIFVRGRVTRMDGLAPERGCVAEETRGGIEMRVIQADLGDLQGAAEHPPRPEPMARPGREEGDRLVGLDHRPGRPAGIPVEAGGYVHRDDMRIPRIQPKDRLGRRPFDRAIEAGAVECIDGHIPACGREGGEEVSRPFPKAGHPGRRAAIRRGIRENLHPMPALREKARGDIAIAAIVAGAAKNRDGSAVPARSRKAGGNRPPGLLHQARDGQASCFRAGIGCARLGIGEEKFQLFAHGHFPGVA